MNDILPITKHTKNLRKYICQNVKTAFQVFIFPLAFLHFMLFLSQRPCQPAGDCEYSPSKAVLSPVSSLGRPLQGGAGSPAEGAGAGQPALGSSVPTVTLTPAARAPPGAASVAGPSGASSGSPCVRTKGTAF